MLGGYVIRCQACASWLVCSLWLCYFEAVVLCWQRAKHGCVSASALVVACWSVATGITATRAAAIAEAAVDCGETRIVPRRMTGYSSLHAAHKHSVDAIEPDSAVGPP